MEFPRRTFDGEGVKADVDFGPTLMLNRNRCILCTRCVRFMREVDDDAQISIVARGQRQPDRDVQRAGRPLADLRQPDGRVPGRRDHDARLPLQVAPVGQPRRGRHDLHAVLEGLQHDGVDQGQARMGEGRAAGPLHAALRAGGQRLLDVRHRPLRLPLDRRRVAADRAARPRRRRAPSVHDVGCGAEGAGGARRRGRPVGADVPDVGARVERGDLPRRAARGRDRGELEGQRQEAAGRHEVQGAGRRRAERARRSRSGAAGRRLVVAGSLGAPPGGRSRSGRRALCLRPGPGGVDWRCVVGGGGAAVGQGAASSSTRAS